MARYNALVAHSTMNDILRETNPPVIDLSRPLYPQGNNGARVLASKFLPLDELKPLVDRTSATLSKDQFSSDRCPSLMLYLADENVVHYPLLETSFVISFYGEGTW